MNSSQKCYQKQELQLNNLQGGKKDILINVIVSFHSDTFQVITRRFDSVTCNCGSFERCCHIKRNLNRCSAFITRQQNYQSNKNTIYYKTCLLFGDSVALQMV